MTGSASSTEGRVPSRPRRRRTVTESLLSIVLVLEAIVTFFASLTIFGLKVLEPALPAWVALPSGAIFIIVLLATTALLRYPWGVAVGWALQVALIALGILIPLMYVVGGGFALLWIYCLTRGRRIDGGRKVSANSKNSKNSTKGASS